jgi:hypothetical protein
MNGPTDEQIRVLAYRLWHEAGSPEGRADEFWVLAQQQLASEPGMGSAAPGGLASDASASL